MPDSLSGSAVWWSYTCTLMYMLAMLVVVHYLIMLPALVAEPVTIPEPSPDYK